jgi:hypothetical protein
MLFVTVYGPELASLYSFIQQQTKVYGGVSRDQLYASFVPHAGIPLKGQTKNIDDGLNYLKSSGLVEGDSEYSCSKIGIEADDLPFAALLLRRFRQMEKAFPKCIMIDHLYITLLERLYILPDVVWIDNVHTAANQLDLAKEIGGVSIEKIGAWKRVMEFLGLGYRMGNGFYCQYQPDILGNVIQQWSKREGTLQEFFEDHLQTWLPCLTARGEVAHSVEFTLDYLSRQGLLHLVVKQDSPARPYFGNRRLRGIEVL